MVFLKILWCLCNVLEGTSSEKNLVVSQGVLDIALKLLKDFSRENIDYIQLKNFCILYLHATDANPPVKFEMVRLI